MTITWGSWKQPKYLLLDEWVKKMWYIHTMEYQGNPAIWDNMDEPGELYAE